MIPNSAKVLRNLVLMAAGVAQSLLLGCANPKQSSAPRQTNQQQELSRTVFTQGLTIIDLRQRLDEVAPGESKKFGSYPGESDEPEAPASGPDYARGNVPGAGPPESVADLKKVNEKQEALIKALKARLKELEGKKS